MKHYFLHGCTIESSFAIPDLAELPASNGLSLALTRTGQLWKGDETAYRPWRPDDTSSQNPGLRLQFLKGPEGYLIRFVGIADYLISLDGTHILLHLEEDTLSEIVRDILVGPILATAMVIQGAYALHGSCVTRDGSSVAFIGHNCAGKSTIATSYVSEGWELMTDGMFVARVADGHAMVQPGDPRIRVRPDAAGFLDYLPQLSAGGQEVAKYRLAIGENGWGQFASTPQPLRVAYLLDPCDPEEGIVLEPCKGADAIMTLTINTYGVNTYQKEFLKDHLIFAGQFLNVVPLRRLRYTKKLENLAPMLELLAADAAQFLP